MVFFVTSSKSAAYMVFGTLGILKTLISFGLGVTLIRKNDFKMFCVVQKFGQISTKAIFDIL